MQSLIERLCHNMCGRFMVVDDIRKTFPAAISAPPEPVFQPRYNIAPGAPVTVLTWNRAGELALVDMCWGLVPRWSTGKGRGYAMFNARSETIRDKPAFRDSFRRRRAVVPASGYYEWQAVGDGGRKQPWLVAPVAAGPVFFAAIWEQWRGPEGEVFLSVAIVTTAAIESLAQLHPRMPVVLTAGESLRWLEPDRADADLDQLMAAGSSCELCVRAVHPRLGNARLDGPEVLEFI